MSTIPWRATHQNAVMPCYAHEGDAGADLCATETLIISPGERVLVGTGIALALPTGCVGLITPRSGLAARAGLGIVNSPGVIDAGYRGEIKVCLINLDPNEPIHIKVGDRIAQLVVLPYVSATFTQVDALDDTSRGVGGYGSTGGATALSVPDSITMQGKK